MCPTFLCLIMAAHAAASPISEGQVIPLTEQTDQAPRLHLFLLDKGDTPRPAVIVCPGGGYHGLAMDYEGVEVAQWLNRNGVAAFVLEYRVAPNRHPLPLQDAQHAVRLVRARAGEWGIAPDRIGMLGFSAGGHLVSTAATHFDLGDAGNAVPLARVSCRPDFTVLIYPVISFSPEFGHLGSRDNLLGNNADEALTTSLCNDLQVTPDTPPAFLVHSTADTGVPSENSIAYYRALVRAKVPAELHIYEKGEHGYGMGKGDPALSTWPDLCIHWMVKRGLLQTP